jgi:lipid II:glycine glycyltransferase (peptidoglycan interpeptide bridge formation enzyme)
MMRLATPEEIARWNELVKANPDGGNVLQCRAFGEVKNRHGWESRYLLSDQTAILALVRQIPLLGEMWYIPKGPGISGPAEFQDFVKAADGTKAFMIKIDPEILSSLSTPAALAKMGLVRARDVQYNVSTVVVNLRPNEDDILNSFKQKTRYNVRLAMKKGVTVEAVQTTDESIDEMYDLYKTTTKRAGVYLRSKEYFADFWRLHARENTGQMFFAKYEGKILAGAFITFLGSKALYKDGGSIREHTDVQAPYLLQWEIMRWLKAQGVSEYDLHGVPPKDQLDNPQHPLAGLARFKLGFNPEVTEFIGTYDLPLSAWKYRLWQRVGERLAMSYEFRIKKQLFY